MHYIRINNFKLSLPAWPNIGVMIVSFYKLKYTLNDVNNLFYKIALYIYNSGIFLI